MTETNYKPAFWRYKSDKSFNVGNLKLLGNGIVAIQARLDMYEPTYLSEDEIEIRWKDL